MIELKIASNKAIGYACRHFHYAGRPPCGNQIGYAVFSDGEWCGVVTFGGGSNRNIGKPYNLKQGEICELTRVALNGKQPTTSQVVGACLRRLKKDAPLVRLVISYADADQAHFGTIYQATNWVYQGVVYENTLDGAYIIKGKKIHGRTISELEAKKGGLAKLGMTRDEFVRKYLDPQATACRTKGKRSNPDAFSKKSPVSKSVEMLSFCQSA